MSGKRTGPGRTTAGRWLGRTAGVGVAAVVCLAATAGLAAAKPVNPSNGQISAAQSAADAAAQKAAADLAAAKPVNPSNGQISAAQSAADAAAAQVGQINAQLAQAQASVSQARGQANIALDRYEGEQQAYEDAQATATAADAAAQKAAADLAAAQAAVASFARTSYMSGSTNPAVEGLLTSGSPSQVLERAALLDAAGDHRSNVVDQVTVVRTQADAASGAAKQAVAKAATLKQQAATALAHAEQLEASARQQAQTVQAQQVTLQAQLQQAQQTLVSLKGQRAAYEIYQQQQSAAAAAAAAKAAAAARSATVSTPKRSTAAAPAPVSSAGSADGSAVETAIRAARRWIGTIYAWGGGSTTGPSVGWGVDKGVVGFDCSGLTRYAYAQAGITIPRNSSDQYMALPKVSLSNLQRGDLVFYAYDTSDPSTIHHVALYLGGNRMIEAPESGETIHETALRTGGLLGAVRPSA